MRSARQLELAKRLAREHHQLFLEQQKMKPCMNCVLRDFVSLFSHLLLPT